MAIFLLVACTGSSTTSFPGNLVPSCHPPPAPSRARRESRDRRRTGAALPGGPSGSRARLRSPRRSRPRRRLAPRSGDRGRRGPLARGGSLGQSLEHVWLGNREPARQRELARADRDPVQRRDQRRVRGTRGRRAVDALERRVEPLGPQLEVSLLVEDLAQQRQDCGACTRAGVATCLGSAPTFAR